MSNLLQRMGDKYVGKKFTVNCGWTCEVLDYKNNKEVFVRWEEDGTEQIVSSGGLRTGNIRPKYRPTIADIGVNDLSGLVDTGRGSIYQKWASMIKRCYCEKAAAYNPSYIFVEVDKPWLRLSNFYEWASQFKGVENLELDKDIIGSGVLYSPDNCLLVPKYINGFFLTLKKPLKFVLKDYLNKWEVAVSGNGGGYVGVYSSKEEALEAYKEAKYRVLYDILERYRGEDFYSEYVERKILSTKLIDECTYE